MPGLCFGCRRCERISVATDEHGIPPWPIQMQNQRSVIRKIVDTSHADVTPASTVRTVVRRANRPYPPAPVRSVPVSIRTANRRSLRECPVYLPHCPTEPDQAGALRHARSRFLEPGPSSSPKDRQSYNHHNQSLGVDQWLTSRVCI